jgi:hypothetical protein
LPRHFLVTTNYAIIILRFENQFPQKLKMLRKQLDHPSFEEKGNAQRQIARPAGNYL